jgi:hypothetical protein
MKAIVTLAQGHDNIVMISKNNPESAAIMLRSETMSANDQGFLQTEKRVGLFKGNTAEIQKLGAILKPGDDFSQKVFPVRLVIKETFEPAYEGHQPKINPTTKETVTSEGAPVYRQTVVVAEASAEKDVFLATDREPVAVKTAAEAVPFAGRK